MQCILARPHAPLHKLLPQSASHCGSIAVTSAIYGRFAVRTMSPYTTYSGAVLARQLRGCRNTSSARQAGL